MNGQRWVSLDLDDLLVDFLNPYLVHLNQVAQTAFVARDIVSTDWSLCVDREGRQVDGEQALSALARMVLSEDLLALTLRPGVREGLALLKANGVSIVLNTHRRYRAFPVALNERFARLTQSWVKQQLGDVVDDLEIVQGAQEKLEVCDQYAALVHCDDRYGNLKPIAAAGRCHAILLDATWNAHQTTAPRCAPLRRGLMYRALSVEEMFLRVQQAVGLANLRGEQNPGGSLDCARTPSRAGSFSRTIPATTATPADMSDAVPAPA